MIVFIVTLSAINLVFGLVAWILGLRSFRRNSVENFAGFGCMVAGPIIAFIGVAGLMVVLFAGDTKVGFASVIRDITGAIEFLLAAPILYFINGLLVAKYSRK